MFWFTFSASWNRNYKSKLFSGAKTRKIQHRYQKWQCLKRVTGFPNIHVGYPCWFSGAYVFLGGAINVIPSEISAARETKKRPHSQSLQALQKPKKLGRCEKSLRTSWRIWIRRIQYPCRVSNRVCTVVYIHIFLGIHRSPWGTIHTVSCTFAGAKGRMQRRDFSGILNPVRTKKMEQFLRSDETPRFESATKKKIMRI